MVINDLIIGSLIVAFGWSLVPIIDKIILKDIPAETLFLWYYLMSSTIFSFYVLFNWNRLNFYINRINTTNMTQLLVMVLIGSFTANYFYYVTLENNQAYIVTLLTGLFPIFTILIAQFYLGENITAKQWMGIILTLIGITVTMS